MPPSGQGPGLRLAALLEKAFAAAAAAAAADEGLSPFGPALSLVPGSRFPITAGDRALFLPPRLLVVVVRGALPEAFEGILDVDGGRLGLIAIGISSVVFSPSVGLFVLADVPSVVSVTIFHLQPKSYLC